MTRWIKVTLAAAVVIVLAGGLFWYWHHEALYPSTDDAYVQAHVVRIAPEVTGEVAAIYVQNYQQVKAGQRLLEIDQRPFEIALAAAQAELDSALQEAGAADATVKSARARVSQRQAELTQARQNAERMVSLARKHLVSQAQRDEAIDTLRSAEAQLAAAQSDLETAKRKLGEKGHANAQVRAAQAAVEKAQLDLSYTMITAPADGVVADVSVRPGDVVQANASLFALVESGRWWVDANYQETALKRLTPGMPATIHIDMYPGFAFHGVVQSISPASGVSFSLLPPENATGNWVKVKQRFPVRVLITDRDPDRPFRIGASAQVTVDTTAGSRSIAMDHAETAR